jgi:hypothetical protein
MQKDAYNQFLLKKSNLLTSLNRLGLMVCTTMTTLTTIESVKVI